MSDAARVRVDLANRSYDIVVGGGLLARGGEELAAVAGSDLIVVTDANLAATPHLARFEASLDTAGSRHRRIVLP